MLTVQKFFANLITPTQAAAQVPVPAPIQEVAPTTAPVEPEKELTPQELVDREIAGDYWNVYQSAYNELTYALKSKDLNNGVATFNPGSLIGFLKQHDLSKKPLLAYCAIRDCLEQGNATALKLICEISGTYTYYITMAASKYLYAYSSLFGDHGGWSQSPKSLSMAILQCQVTHKVDCIKVILEAWKVHLSSKDILEIYTRSVDHAYDEPSKAFHDYLLNKYTHLLTLTEIEKTAKNIANQLLRDTSFSRLTSNEKKNEIVLTQAYKTILPIFFKSILEERFLTQDPTNSQARGYLSSRLVAPSFRSTLDSSNLKIIYTEALSYFSSAEYAHSNAYIKIMLVLIELRDIKTDKSEQIQKVLQSLAEDICSHPNENVSNMALKCAVLQNVVLNSKLSWMHRTSSSVQTLLSDLGKIPNTTEEEFNRNTQVTRSRLTAM